jgi:hypothetical protein
VNLTLGKNAEDVGRDLTLGNYPSIFLHLKSAVAPFKVISQPLSGKNNGKSLTITGLRRSELSRYEGVIICTPRYLVFIAAVFI